MTHYSLVKMVDLIGGYLNKLNHQIKQSVKVWLESHEQTHKNVAVIYNYTVDKNWQWTQLNVHLVMFLLVTDDYGCHDKWIYQWDDVLDKD